MFLRREEDIMMRTFKDPSGTEWDVFEVHPDSARTVSRVPVAFRGGWLCFQSARERRRLAPIPPGWEDWDIDALTSALQTTHGMARRTPQSFDAQATPPRRTSGEAPAMA
ncbi:MAG: hypothetical protein ABIY52_16270 [Gemmatimonadaceae bacterium]